MVGANAPGRFQTTFFGPVSICPYFVQETAANPEIKSGTVTTASLGASEQVSSKGPPSAARQAENAQRRQEVSSTNKYFIFILSCLMTLNLFYLCSTVGWAECTKPNILSLLHSHVGLVSPTYGTDSLIPSYPRKRVSSARRKSLDSRLRGNDVFYFNGLLFSGELSSAGPARS